ncbi:MAG: DegT/DnrJ/EryC1/StrS family aminotransferase [Erysipelotrichaceae bacterium]|nr:DegT/DnrJ/EryC1/StrS family aminotransferase [Erysipelotrichaceae bacterium]
MNWKIPLFKIYSDDNDVDQVAEVIRSGMNWATGPKVNELESRVADYVGTKYAVTLNSGTSALHAQLLAHEIGKGDEVIVPSFTFIATANCPFFVGAKPKFADIEKDYYGLDPESVKECITKKTKAIMPVHVGGYACKVEELREIADDHGILLLEDAAESLGAKVNNKMVGTFGESSMFSFCGPKVITTGEGGVIVTDSKDIYEKIKLLRSHGRADTKDYFSTNEYLDYVSLGYNFRMSNITAALGVAQMDKLDKIISIRRKNAEYLTKAIKKAGGAVKTPSPSKDRFHLFQMYTIESDDRDALMKVLGDAGIMAKVYFPPVHLSHFYRNVLKYSPALPMTEKLASRCLTLPMYPQLTKDEMDYMAEQIGKFSERK